MSGKATNFTSFYQSGEISKGGITQTSTFNAGKKQLSIIETDDDDNISDSQIFSLSTDYTASNSAIDKVDENDPNFIKFIKAIDKKESNSGNKPLIRNELYSWMEKYKAGFGQELTHGSYGTSYYISLPIEQEKNFLTCFAKAVEDDDRKADFCMTPCFSTPYFNFAADIDLKSNTPMDLSIGIEYGKCLMKALKKCFPNIADEEPSSDWPNAEKSYDDKKQQWMGAGFGKNRFKILISTSGEKKKKVEKKGSKSEMILDDSQPEEEKYFYKRGFHLYTLGRFAVTREEGTALAVIFGDICESVMGPRNPGNGENSHFEAIDKIYSKSLRPLFGSKAEKCSVCALSREYHSGKKKETERKNFIWGIAGFNSSSKTSYKSGSYLSTRECKTCQNSGFVMQKSAHSPICVLNYDESVTTLLNKYFYHSDSTLENPKFNKLELLLATSIRNAIRTENDLQPFERFKFPAEYGNSIVEFLTNNNVSVESKKRKSSSSTFQKSEKFKDKGFLEVSEEYPVTSDIFQLVEQEIQQLHPCWENLKGATLVKNKKYGFKFTPKRSAKPGQDPTRYCSIINDCHHMNSIFFNISSKRITQACGNATTCQKKSRSFPVSKEIVQILFPHAILLNSLNTGSFLTPGVTGTPPFVPDDIDDNGRINELINDDILRANPTTLTETNSISLEARTLNYLEFQYAELIKFTYPAESQQFLVDGLSEQMKKKSNNVTGVPFQSVAVHVSSSISVPQQSKPTDKKAKKTKIPAPLSFYDDDGNLIHTNIGVPASTVSRKEKTKKSAPGLIVWETVIK